MSSLKRKKDLEILEKQLGELESNFFDPIERIEQKKELEKKIKKLKLSQNQVEKLEQEQQELETLKAEFTLDKTQLDEQKKLENISLLKIKVNSSEPEQVSEQQTNLINLNQTSSATIINTNSTPYNSQELKKAWIISGTIGFFIFLGILINGSKSNQIVIDAEKPITDTISSETFEQNNSLEMQKVTQLQSEKIDNPIIEQAKEINSNYDFPLNSCGDRDPGGENTWYPVYINDTLENLNLVRNNYCGDAIRKYRTREQIKSIQVASFTDELKAIEFAKLMQLHIGSGEVGKPARYNFDNFH